MSDTEVLPAKRVRKSTAKAEQAAASDEASKMSDSEDEIFLPTDSEDEVLLPINYDALLTMPSKKSAVKAKKQPKKPQADGEAGPSRPKAKAKPKVAEPCKTCGRSPKKKARAGAAAKKVKPVKARGQFSLVSGLCHPGISFWPLKRSHHFLLKKVRI